MAFSNPSVAEFKSAFARAFPFNSDPAQGVTDDDIMNAFLQVNATINVELFPAEATYKLAYLNLAAHFLVLTLRASAGGLSGGSFGFLEQSKSVGSVSQSFVIPQAIQNNPLWAAYMSTPWGQFYLNSLLPALVGPVFVVRGATTA